VWPGLLVRLGLVHQVRRLVLLAGMVLLIERLLQYYLHLLPILHENRGGLTSSKAFEVFCFGFLVMFAY
jgi:hypothetical protein